MLSKKAKYALKALEYIARNNDRKPLLIAEIAAEQKIPKKFLEVILLELKKDGLLGSRLGKLGGYFLNVPAADIRIGHLVRLIDGPVALVPCVSYRYYQPCPECRDERICGLRNVMAQVREATNSVLDQVTLEDVLLREDSLEKALMN
jgi:Rrf2 family protein